MTQTQAVLDWLKSGDTITSMEAFSELGVTRLSAIIFRLRKKGYDIQGDNIEHTNRFGGKVIFKEYKLVGQMELKGV